MSKTLRDTFVSQIRQNDENIDLAYSALLMAQYLTEPFDTTFYLDMLDKMADAVRPAMGTADTDFEKIRALNKHLFEDLGFSGNNRSYYKPENSFLNKVLESKKGIPISLSVVYIEVGRRLDLPLWGVGIPQHFIVAYGTQEEPIYIDVFDQGQILTEIDCMVISGHSFSDQESFERDYLKPATKRAILYRMLQNLKYLYLDQKNWEATYNTIDLAVEVYPNQLNELRDRGLMAYRLNRFQDAIFDISRYLHLAPDGEDKAWLEQRIEIMEEQLLRLN